MLRKFLVVTFILLLSGCSSKFAYNNFDWLVYWYLDDYVELSSDQEAIFDEQLNTWLTWHRQEELVLYKQHLQEVKQDVELNNLSREIISAHLDKGREHFERVRSEISPSLAQMAVELDEEQITYFFAALEKKNQEDEKDIEKRRKDGRQKAIERRVEDITDDLSDEIGRLTPEQKTIVAQYAPRFVSTSDEWLAYRRNIQNEARMLFNTRHENPQFSQQLLALMTNPDAYRSQEYVENRNANRQLFLDLVVEIVPTLTDKQRSKMVKEIDDIIEDLDDLMAD